MGAQQDSTQLWPQHVSLTVGCNDRVRVPSGYVFPEALITDMQGRKGCCWSMRNTTAVHLLNIHAEHQILTAHEGPQLALLICSRSGASSPGSRLAWVSSGSM